MHGSPGRRGLRLTVDFAGWLGTARLPPERFFREALVVLDANVLLDLYRITPDARVQVMETLSGIANRLWVPHQAAVEFSRNRKQVAKDRISSLKQTRHALRSATTNAVDALESAVEQLLYQRERNGTTRVWEAADAGLDRESLLTLLDGLMDPALAELDALSAEHDLHPQNMQTADTLLSQIDELLNGRIGPGYETDRLRTLVEEAHEFRFPNQIPPGFLDVGKNTQLQAAGDFLLWRQTIDRAAQIADKNRLVLLITKDLKADWWDLDAKKRPLGPRPELVQELRESAGADLLLLSLKDFLAGAQRYLSSSVSDQTLYELQEVSDEIDALLPDVFRDPDVVPDLLNLPYREFLRLIRYLLMRQGYVVEEARATADGGFDLILLDESDGEGRIVIVEAKRSIIPVGLRDVRQLRGTLLERSFDSALLITTGSFTHPALEAVQNTAIQLVDGAALLQLLDICGIHATIGATRNTELPKSDLDS